GQRLALEQNSSLYWSRIQARKEAERKDEAWHMCLKNDTELQ
ncbi:hypothetical protein Tco_1454105, partial [Tanacetum coccineum]